MGRILSDVCVCCGMYETDCSICYDCDFYLGDNFDDFVRNNKKPKKSKMEKNIKTKMSKISFEE